MKKLAIGFATAASLVAFAGAAVAAPVVTNGTIAGGTAAFDATVAGADGIVVLDTLSSLGSGSSWDRGAYTISSTDGSNRGIDASYLVSGDAIGIDPYAPSEGSGLTFVFDNPINAFGLEIGDWATCCYTSNLYIAFDGGSVNLVASANSSNDNPGWVAGDGYRNFIGAFDTSNTFSKVTFYGDGFGEYLVAGGTIRYATLELGSVGGIPEPTTWAMMIIGFGAAGSVIRRRRGQMAVA
jgi:hypothetical protein